MFTKKDEPIFCIAGIWRETPEIGLAFTMLTMVPGPDIAPYHDRQIVILDRTDLADWLDRLGQAADKTASGRHIGDQGSCLTEKAGRN